MAIAAPPTATMCSAASRRGHFACCRALYARRVTTLVNITTTAMAATLLKKSGVNCGDKDAPPGQGGVRVGRVDSGADALTVAQFGGASGKMDRVRCHPQSIHSDGVSIADRVPAQTKSGCAVARHSCFVDLAVVGNTCTQVGDRTNRFKPISVNELGCGSAEGFGLIWRPEPGNEHVPISGG